MTISIKHLKMASLFRESIINFLNKKSIIPVKINITRVNISKDFRKADIYFSCLYIAEEDINNIKSVINDNIVYIRKNIANMVKVKYMPELEFLYDYSIQEAINLNHNIIHSVNDL